MTCACVATNVSSELNTGTKNAGMRSTNVIASRTRNMRASSRRAEAGARASGRVTSCVDGSMPTSFCPLGARYGPSDRFELVGVVALAAQGALELPRRRLGQRARSHEYHVDRGNAHDVADHRGHRVAQRRGT